MLFIILLFLLLSSCNVLNIKKDEPNQFAVKDKISDLNFNQAEEEKNSWFSHPFGGAIAGAFISVLVASPYLLIDGAVCAGSGYLAAAGCSSLVRDLAFFSAAGGLVGATMGITSYINSNKTDNDTYYLGNDDSSESALKNSSASGVVLLQTVTEQIVESDNHYLFFPGEEKLVSPIKKIASLLSKK
jgi:hypothetical protein